MSSNRCNGRTCDPKVVSKLGPHVLKELDREGVFPLGTIVSRYLYHRERSLPVRIRQPNWPTTGLQKLDRRTNFGISHRAAQTKNLADTGW